MKTLLLFPILLYICCSEEFKDNSLEILVSIEEREKARREANLNRYIGALRMCKARGHVDFDQHKVCEKSDNIIVKDFPTHSIAIKINTETYRHQCARCGDIITTENSTEDTITIWNKD